MEGEAETETDGQRIDQLIFFGGGGGKPFAIGQIKKQYAQSFSFFTSNRAYLSHYFICQSTKILLSFISTWISPGFYLCGLHYEDFPREEGVLRRNDKA